jgi:hypothetical protein
VWVQDSTHGYGCRYVASLVSAKNTKNYIYSSDNLTTQWYGCGYKILPNRKFVNGRYLKENGIDVIR